jgi:hypothetical protein
VCAKDGELDTIDKALIDKLDEQEPTNVCDYEKQYIIKEITRLLESRFSTHYCQGLLAAMENRLSPDFDSKEDDKRTAFIKAYNRISDMNPDCLLLFKVDDLYLALFDDAELCAEILGLPLKYYSGESSSHVTIPGYIINGCVNKLLKAGWKVALREQAGERDIIRIVTPESLNEQNKP